MVILGLEEGPRRLDRGDNRRLEHPGFVQLGDVGPGDLVLLGGGRKDCRPILRADALPIELRWIMATDTATDGQPGRCGRVEGLGVRRDIDGKHQRKSQGIL